MKNNIFMRILVIALVAMSIMAIAIPAMADYRPWQNRWNAHSIFPNTYPPAGSTLETQIENLQEDINTFRNMHSCFSTSNSGYYFDQLKIDGKYGPKTVAAVTMIQKYYSLSQDGICGQLTKNALWNGLGFTPIAN